MPFRRLDGALITVKLHSGIFLAWYQGNRTFQQLTVSNRACTDYQEALHTATKTEIERHYGIACTVFLKMVRKD